MSRKNNFQRRKVDPDPKFGDVVVAKFLNTILKDGKRSTAEGIFYGALEIIRSKTNQDGLKVFRKALDNAKPVLEVKSRRIGGATYQVPIEVKPERRQSLASRWLVDAARSRAEHSLRERLAFELIDAAEGRGIAIKKREDVHKMAEANRAFSHFRW